MFSIRFFLFNFIIIGIFVISAVTSFTISDKISTAEKEKTKYEKMIAEQENKMKLLETQWAYLSSPARISKYMSEYFDLAPAKAHQTGLR